MIATGLTIGALISLYVVPVAYACVAARRSARAPQPDRPAVATHPA